MPSDRSSKLKTPLLSPFTNSVTSPREIQDINLDRWRELLEKGSIENNKTWVPKGRRELIPIDYGDVQRCLNNRRNSNNYTGE